MNFVNICIAFKRKSISFLQYGISSEFSLNFVFELMIISFGIVKDFGLVSHGYEVDLNEKLVVL